MNYRTACIPVLLLLLGGCLNQDLSYLTIELDGTEQGEGGLAHPLGWIDGVELDDSGSFTHQLDYPLHRGSGLFVYAWQDLDSDGLLCSPGGPSEPSGGSDTIETLNLQITVEVALDAVCLGPERLIFENTLY